MYTQIGTINRLGKHFIIEEATDGCSGCYFYRDGELHCTEMKVRCKWWTRKDERRKSIIFIRDEQK